MRVFSLANSELVISLLISSAVSMMMLDLYNLIPGDLTIAVALSWDTGHGQRYRLDLQACCSPRFNSQGGFRLRVARRWHERPSELEKPQDFSHLTREDENWSS